MGINYGAALKNELASAPAKESSKTRGPIPLGKHNGRVTGVKAQTFTKGSYGVKFTYTLEGKGISGRTINEYIVITKATGEATQFGMKKVTNRLKLGLSQDQLNAFAWPASDNEIGDFALLLDKAIIVEVKEEAPYEGRPSRGVKAVYPRDEA